MVDDMGKFLLNGVLMVKMVNDLVVCNDEIWMKMKHRT